MSAPPMYGDPSQQPLPPPQAPYAPPPPQYAVEGSPYQGQPQQPATSVLVVQTPPQMPARFPADPCQVTCPTCKAVVTTVTEPMNGLLTWLIVGVFCIIGCCLCACIPCCIDALRDVRHSCPNCNSFIGRFERLK